MATWPSSLTYSEDGYGWKVQPDVTRVEYSSRNTRQRRLGKNRDDVFSISVRTNDAGLVTFETFIVDTNNGADEYTGPYFVNDVEYTGTLQILNGQYSVRYVSDDHWVIEFEAQLKNRSMTEESNIYALVNSYSGFTGLYDIMQATEDAVNNNNL